MNWPNMVAEFLPRIAKGAVTLTASRMVQMEEPEDLTIEFLGRELEIFDRYQARKEQEAVLAPIPAAPQHQLEFRTPTVQQAAPCPFCKMEETAGTIKNHLAFVSGECSADGLGPATGGMVPKAQSALDEVEALAQGIQAAAGPAAPLAALVIGLCNELKPKLDWVNSCEAAEKVADLAHGLWMVTAKAAQVNFSQPARHG